MNSCLFCRIIAGELPSKRLYEDQRFIAILDIHPVNFGHLLIMPKAHEENFLAAGPATLTAIFPLAQNLARAVMRTTGASGFNLLINNGRLSGQLIDHLHIHIVPRLETDGLKHWPGKTYAEGEMQAMGEKIRANLKTV